MVHETTNPISPTVTELIDHASPETNAAYHDCVQASAELGKARASGVDQTAVLDALTETVSGALVRLQTGRRTAIEAMIDALEHTAPRAAFVPIQNRDVERIDMGKTARFMWLLAVAGAGRDGSLDAWNRYAQTCHRWLAEYVTSSLIEEMLGNTLTNIESTARRARVMVTSTRLRWVSDLMCTALGEWGDAQAPAASMFGSAAMEAINRSADLLIGAQRGIADATTFREVPDDLLRLLTASHGEPARFEELLFGTDPEMMPLVEIDGTLQAINAEDWYYGREVAILGAMRSTMHGAIGTAYEEAIVKVTDRVAPPGVAATHNVHLGVSGRSKKDADEVDFLLTADDLVVIGEAKSHIPARQPRGVASSYTDQVLRSVKQLNTRLDHVEGGATIQERPGLLPASHVFGLSLPLHDYGGTVWRGDAIAQAEVRAQVVMPLHGYALALSCLDDATDLAGYLAYRAGALAAPYAGLDELEPLISWMSGAAKESPLLPQGYHVGVFRAYELDRTVTLKRHVPDRDRRAFWIEEVFAYTLPVAGDPLAGPWGDYVDVNAVFDRLESHIADVLTTKRLFSLARAANMPTWLQLWREPEIAAATVIIATMAARQHLQGDLVGVEYQPKNEVELEAIRLLTEPGPLRSLEPSRDLMQDPASVALLIIDIVRFAGREPLPSAYGHRSAE